MPPSGTGTRERAPASGPSTLSCTCTYISERVRAATQSACCPPNLENHPCMCPALPAGSIMIMPTLHRCTGSSAKCPNDIGLPDGSKCLWCVVWGGAAGGVSRHI